MNTYKTLNKMIGALILLLILLTLFTHPATSHALGSSQNSVSSDAAGTALIGCPMPNGKHCAHSDKLITVPDLPCSDGSELAFSAYRACLFTSLSELVYTDAISAHDFPHYYRHAVQAYFNSKAIPRHEKV